MKVRIALAVVGIVTLLSGTTSAADKVSFGLGIGALYNGAGINLAFLKSSDLKFIAVGCTEMSRSSIDGTNVTCGISAGWMKSDILSKKNSKHGLGLTLGVDYDQLHSEAEPVLSIPYAYFFKGIVAQGFNIGLAPFVRWDAKGTEFGAYIEVGFQF